MSIVQEESFLQSFKFIILKTYFKFGSRGFLSGFISIDYTTVTTKWKGHDTIQNEFMEK